MADRTSHPRIPATSVHLSADLTVPDLAQGLVIFAHGSGSGRHSPRNQAVARVLQTNRLATLLADLLTEREEAVDRVSAHLRFNIDLLARRVIALVDWAQEQPSLETLPVGLFGASTGAAAALTAAAARRSRGAAGVSRGGRPDLAPLALPHVTAPTLMLVGSEDTDVIELNRWAKSRMRCPVTLEIVPGASHLFEEPGALDLVASQAADWFRLHLLAPASAARAER